MLKYTGGELIFKFSPVPPLLICGPLLAGNSDLITSVPDSSADTETKCKHMLFVHIQEQRNQIIRCSSISYQTTVCSHRIKHLSSLGLFPLGKAGRIEMISVISQKKIPKQTLPINGIMQIKHVKQNKTQREEFFG